MGDHKEIWPLKSRSFKSWLANAWYQRGGKPPSTQDVREAVNVLHAEALFESAEYPIFTRIGHWGEKLYVFLANQQWQAIEIDANGWRIISESPVFFVKPKGMLALPEPSAGGDIEELRRYVNVVDNGDWVLLISWLLAAFSPQGPYPILFLCGEQGSAKSTTTKILRDLIDPSFVTLRSLPKSERDLIIAAKNNWVLAFDNISKLPTRLSDAFCRLSTGGGLSTRELYTDSEEVLFKVKRPIILNGIDDLATRGDLVDRAIIINLPRITGTSRKLERTIERDFEAVRPRILGAILNLVSGILATKDKITAGSYSRMADFEHWINAAEIGAQMKGEILWAPGTFNAVYREKRESASINCLDAEPLADLVERLMEMNSVWEGCAADLLSLFEDIARAFKINGSVLPKAPQWLVHRLKRITPNLRDAGIIIEFIDKRPKKIIIKKAASVAIGRNPS